MDASERGSRGPIPSTCPDVVRRGSQDPEPLVPLALPMAPLKGRQARRELDGKDLGLIISPQRATSVALLKLLEHTETPEIVTRWLRS